MVSLGGISTGKLIKVFTDFAMLNVTTQLVNTLSLPAAAKGIINVSIALGNIQILRKLTKGMPMGGLVNGLMAINEATIIIQSIPNLIAGFTGAGATSTTAVTTTSSTSNF